jgi:predicted methyltransferase
VEALLGFRPVDIGATVLVGLVVLMVLRGQLVTRKQLDDLRADKDAQIAAERAEKNTWREAHALSEEARREAQDQAGELLELARTAGHFYKALPHAGEVTTDAALDHAAVPPTS